MKQININFVDFFGDFNKIDNDFINVLREHYDVVISDEPDYIFYSGFGYDHLKYDCIRIYFTGECITPDFNDCDYAIGFDRLQFGDRYARIPLYNIFQYKAGYESLRDRMPFTKEDIQGREFCTFVVSNCFAKEARSIFFEKLNKYKIVASGGRYKNNIGGAVADKKAFLSKYKFNIAFENCSHDGYVTEKIMEAFAAGVVPIYYGDPRISEDFNPAAFINALDYEDYETMIERIKKIDADEDLYLSMLNAPIIQPNADVADLEKFLCNIFDQSLETAIRRPHSQCAKNQEAFKLRHKFFEAHIYRYYKGMINQIKRFHTGTFLTAKRTK